MNEVKILVVEDELLIADNISNTLTDLGYSVLEPVINYTEAVNAIDLYNPDIAILDINLSGFKSGIDLAHLINEKYNFPFIFLTSNTDKETIDVAKKVSPPAYLVKPFTQEELYSAIEIALYNYSTKTNQENTKKDNLLINNSLFFKDRGVYVKVKFEEILYIKSDHVYVEIVLLNDKKYVVRLGLNDILEKTSNKFIRVHRSYIVNTDYIDEIQSSKLIVNEVEIPLGKKYKDDVLKKVNLA